MRMCALLAERETAVNGGDPGPLAEADRALRECLVTEADEAYRQLIEGARALAASILRTGRRRRLSVTGCLRRNIG